MGDNIILNQNSTVGQTVATKEAAGVQHELVMVEYADAGGNPVEVSAANPLPVAATIDTTGLATSANQTTEISGLAAILAKLSSDPATQTTLAAILAKIIAAPATEATLAALSAKITNPLPVSGTVTVDTSLLATAAKQDTGNSYLSTIAGKDFATQTTLAAILAKIIAAPATAANQSTEITALGALLTGIVLAAGGNIIGKVGIDQTTPGTTNGVQVNNTVTTSEAAPTTIFNGKTTVTTAGTRVILASSQAVKSVTIKALSTNTGFIYVGNTSVAASNGFQLLAGDSISMDIANLTTVNIDSSVNGESVSYIGIN